MLQQVDKNYTTCSTCITNKAPGKSSFPRYGAGDQAMLSWMGRLAALVQATRGQLKPDSPFAHRSGSDRGQIPAGILPQQLLEPTQAQTRQRSHKPFTGAGGATR